MFRANSNKGAYLHNDDDDDQQQEQEQMGEMLHSLSEDYCASQQQQSRAGSGENNAVENNDDDEVGAIGDEDQEVDIDFRDPVEQKWVKAMKNPTSANADSSEEGEYFDLFQLVKSDQKNSRRVVDPRHWQVNVTVSTGGQQQQQQKSAAAAASSSTKNRAATTIDNMMANAAVTANNHDDGKKKKEPTLNSLADDNDDDTLNQNQQQGQEEGMGAKSETFTIDITPEEGTEMFLEEIEACKIVYGEENVVVEENSDKKSQMMTVKLQVLSPTDLVEAEEKRNRKSKGLIRWISFVKPIRYPVAPLEPFVEPYNNIFSFQEMQLMYKAMIETAESNKNTPCLFNMVQTATGLSSTFISEGCNIIDDSKKDYIAEQMKAAGFNVRLAHEKLTPSFFIGSISKVLNKLPKGFDVVYVENVMRADLAKRFEAMQRHLFKVHVASKVSKTIANTGQNNEGDSKKNTNPKKGSKDDKNNEDKNNILKSNPALAALCDSRAVFHGTRNTFMENIVAKGLKVPETGKNAEVKVRTGARYGRGCYVTPDPELAICYAENGRRNEYSVKLLVCAVLQGKPNVILDGEEPWGGGLQDPDNKGFTSHESEDGSQIVVFNPAQVLPCYVLHLMERRQRLASNVADLGRGNKTDELEREKQRIEEEYGMSSRQRELEEKRMRGGKSTTKKKTGMSALAEAERKKVMTALARKNLPFGFGPAGSNFVVEEVADYSDDDEDLDEYVGVGYEGAEAFEEYQIAREHDTSEVTKQKFDPYNQRKV